jgi:leucyl aminopeptidase
MIGEISVNQRRAVDDDVIIYLQFQDLKTDLELKSLPANVKKKLDYKIKRLNFQGKEGQTLILEEALDNTAIALLGGGKKQEFNWVKLRDNLANFLRQLNHLRYRRLSLKLRLFKQENYFEVGKQLALAFYLSNYRFLYFKNEEERKKAHYWQSLTVLLSLKKDDSQKLKLGFAYGREISRGIFFARDLVNQPASHITPTSLMEHAFALEKTAPTKIKVEVLDVNECQKLGMGAYLSVGQGSDQPPKFIILHYKPSNAVVKHKVCLIGKSLTFDSGGISLKPAAGMEEMKSDMAGGATVLGIFQVLIANSDYFNHLEVWGILPAVRICLRGKLLSQVILLQRAMVKLLR